jgi:hypothetical protein
VSTAADSQQIAVTNPKPKQNSIPNGNNLKDAITDVDSQSNAERDAESVLQSDGRSDSQCLRPFRRIARDRHFRGIWLVGFQ